MDPLWLVRGGLEAPGWKSLERDSREDKVSLVIFDQGKWALIRAAEPPTQYEGLVPEEPEDGLYVSQHGYPVYVVDRQEVRGAKEVIEALGPEAVELLEKVGDPDATLQRLGKAF